MQKIRHLILILGLLTILLITPVNTAEQEYKKIVSIVFDDSGSMASDIRWSHANYALQTLVSLLDEGDILFLNYMNASEKDIVWEVQRGDSLDAILARIRDESYPDLEGEGETPIESVSNGINRLIPENNSLIRDNVIYKNWLILITDGNEMTDSDGEGYVNYVRDDSFDSGYKWLGVLDRKLASIIGNAPVDLNTVILKIGDSSQDMLITTSMVGSPLIYKSASVTVEDLADKQIVQNMIDISSLISGRLPITINSVESNRLTITSSVPFKSLDLLIQNSNGNVQAIYDSDGNEIEMEISATSMTAPESKTIAGKDLLTDVNLFGGSISLFNNKKEALKEGQYIIEFNTNVSTADFTGFCYPGIQFIFDYYVDGLPVEQVYQEEMVTLEFIPVREGTTEILENLPSSIEYNLEMKNGDQFLSFVEGTLKTNSFIIKDPVIQGSLTATIPEIWFWTLNVAEEIPIAPEESRPEDRVFTLEVTPTTNSVGYQNFDMAGSVYIVPKLNGERLTPEEFEIATLSMMRILDEEEQLTTFEYDLVKEVDFWQFKPSYIGFKPSMPAGQFTFELRCSSEAFEDINEYAFGEFVYIIGDASFFIRYMNYILLIMGVVIVGIYFIGLVLKPRLHQKEYVIRVEYYDSIIDLDAPIKVDKHTIKVNGFNRFFIPFVREVGHAGGFDISAGKKADYIYLSKNSQRIGMELGDLIISASNKGERKLRINVEQKLEFLEDEKLCIFKYSKK